MLVCDIRKGFQGEVDAKCPDCAGPVADMGKDFEAPKRTDVKAWSHLQSLYSVGITFHSCGCSGPGYIPRDREALLAHLAGMLAEYHKHLEFWRQREEPTSRAEADRDRQKSWMEVTRIPRERRNEKDRVSNQDAKRYWFERIAEVEAKIASLQSASPR